MPSSGLEVQLHVRSSRDNVEEDDEAAQNQHTVSNEVMVVPKALAQVLSNCDPLALQIRDKVIGIHRIIQIRKLASDQTINLHGGTRSVDRCTY